VAHDSAGGGEPVLLGGAIELSQENPAGRAHGTARWVHLNRLHEREVYHEPPVAHGVSGDGVPAPAYRDEQVALRREPDGLDDVVEARAKGDERRTPIDGAVPDAASFVITLLSGLHQRIPEAGAQRLDRPRVDCLCLDPHLTFLHPLDQP